MFKQNPRVEPQELRARWPHLTPKRSQNMIGRSRVKARKGLLKVDRPQVQPVKAAVASVAPVAEPTLAEEKVEKSETFWKERHAQLRTKYEQLLAESVLSDRLVELARETAPLSYEPAPALHTIRPSGQHTAQSAVLLLSDTHIGKIVRPEQTLGWGHYDFPKFMSRLRHLEARVSSILMDHTQCSINKLVVAMLGDMVDGSLSHGAEAGQASTVFAQVYAGAHVLAQFLRNLSAYVPQIEVQCVVGNHGRWGTQKKMPTKNRYSNLDMFLYALVQSLVKDVPSIKFDLDEQPFRTFKVENTLVWIGHGDHLRGGDKALGIPVHAIGRQLSSTAQMHAKHQQQVPQIYCVGDKHKRIELPHANGDFIVNGAFPGYDEYAHASNFTDAGADQKLFLVHPVYGRSATYNIYLEQAKDLNNPYSVPAGISIA